MPAATIYKLLTRAEWEAALAEGVYRGSAHDARDGFIHFSTAAQLAGTARKYFAGVARSGAACGGCWGTEQASRPSPCPSPHGRRDTLELSRPLPGKGPHAPALFPSPLGERDRVRGADLRWEPSRGGDLFPHLYGDLPLAAVKTATAIPLGPDGVPIIPDGLEP